MAVESRSRGGILTINGGSSSLKFALFHAAESLSCVLSGKFDRIGLAGGSVTALDAAEGKPERRNLELPNHAACFPVLGELLGAHHLAGEVQAIGHRVVHGGNRYSAPEQISDDVLVELRHLSPFAPAHMPAQIALIEEARRLYPAVPQIACFDTAFHRHLSRVARLLPIPRRYDEAGVQRYGFHGLSYSFLMHELERVAGPSAARGRVILAHLGNGASMAAVRDGRSIDTTMGFTPAAGLVMSTRSGDLDPGVVEYLARTEGMTAQQFYQMVHAKSGLLGVSETSSDVRDLLAREATDIRAAEAVALFCYQAKKWIGALTAVLDGLDAIVFAGGIGENAPEIRARICDGLDYLGVRLDPARNAVNAPIISEAGGRVAVRVIPTNEERFMAQCVVAFMAGGSCMG